MGNVHWNSENRESNGLLISNNTQNGFWFDFFLILPIFPDNTDTIELMIAGECVFDIHYELGLLTVTKIQPCARNSILVGILWQHLLMSSCSFWYFYCLVWICIVLFCIGWLGLRFRNQITIMSIWWIRNFLRYYATRHDDNKIILDSFFVTNLEHFVDVNAGDSVFDADNQSARNYCFHYSPVSL